jgi:lipoprotein-anchoring transpeptidase ErfK/SrfK
MFVIDAQGNVTTINVSSGSGKRFQSAEEGKGVVVAHTPVGEFKVQRSIDGVRNAPLGSLWRPLYFDGGWAIHGNPHVPAYPASHGCVRTADIDQDFVFSVIDIGHGVSVYGKNPPPPDNPAPGF